MRKFTKRAQRYASRAAICGCVALGAAAEAAEAAAARIDFCNREYPADSVSVTCGDPYVVDISPLSEMGSLVELNLEGSGVRDLVPIANLQALTALNVDYTQIRDLSPIANLRTLDVRRTRISKEDVRWLAERLPGCKIHAE